MAMVLEFILPLEVSAGEHVEQKIFFLNDKFSLCSLYQTTFSKICEEYNKTIHMVYIKGYLCQYLK